MPRLPKLGPGGEFTGGDFSWAGGPTLQGAHSQVPNLRHGFVVPRTHLKSLLGEFSAASLTNFSQPALDAF
eukprot:4104794-Amphidinium_carterae.1